MQVQNEVQERHQVHLHPHPRRRRTLCAEANREHVHAHSEQAAATAEQPGHPEGEGQVGQREIAKQVRETVATEVPRLQELQARTRVPQVPQLEGNSILQATTTAIPPFNLEFIYMLSSDLTPFCLKVVRLFIALPLCVT